MGLFDLDEIPALRLPKWLFRHNRPGLLSFYDRDYGAGDEIPLRAQIEAHMREAGIEPDGGPIRVLCMPRLHGYLFAPISVFFCYARSGRLVAIAHDVHNTYGERHIYTLPVSDDAKGSVDQACAKTFRVSPFLGLGLHYQFRVTPPGEKTAVAIIASDREGAVMTASFGGQRKPLSTGAILNAVLTHPLMTLGVWFAIHKEALFLWLKLKRKGARLRPGDAVRN
jgi:DUF1365 family protein